MNKDLIYVSRAFVEFGPFSPAEISDFIQRGILRDIDHMRFHGADVWTPLPSWKPEHGHAPVFKPAGKKAAAKKVAPAKKAAKKASAKAVKKAAKKAPKAD